MADGVYMMGNVTFSATAFGSVVASSCSPNLRFDTCWLIFEEGKVYFQIECKLRIFMANVDQILLSLFSQFSFTVAFYEYIIVQYE